VGKLKFPTSKLAVAMKNINVSPTFDLGRSHTISKEIFILNHNNLIYPFHLISVHFNALSLIAC